MILSSNKSRNLNLLNILSEGAKLSSDIRQYFLANSMVGRLLDQFYGDMSKFNDIFSDMSTIPLFKNNIECYIPEIENDKLIKDFEEDFNLKDDKETTSFNKINYIFFYELVSTLVCSWKFKTTISEYNKTEDHSTNTGLDEDSNLSMEESKNKEQTWKKNESKGMSPFFNHGDQPFTLTQEEQALLLVPTEFMLNKLFKLWNTNSEISLTLGKMYTHISWANKQFSTSYLHLLGEFILHSTYNDIVKKFKIPLLQVLLLEDSPSLSASRAKIAFKYIFTQKFNVYSSKYYIAALEIANFIISLAKSVRSVNELLKQKDKIVLTMIDEFLDKDPFLSITEMEWSPHFSKNNISSHFKEKLSFEDVGESILANIQEWKCDLNRLIWDEEFKFMKIEDTMVMNEHLKGHQLHFFSENIGIE